MDYELRKLEEKIFKKMKETIRHLKKAYANYYDLESMYTKTFSLARAQTIMNCTIHEMKEELDVLNLRLAEAYQERSKVLAENTRLRRELRNATS